METLSNGSGIKEENGSNGQQLPSTSLSWNEEVGNMIEEVEIIEVDEVVEDDIINDKDWIPDVEHESASDDNYQLQTSDQTNTLKRKRLNSSTRQKRDPVWQDFQPVGDGKGKCRYCGICISGRPPRLRSHLAKCSEKLGSWKTSISSSSQQTVPVVVSSQSLAVGSGTVPGCFSNFETGRSEFEMDFGRMVFECNLPFRISEHPSYISFCKKWMRTYKLPSANKIGSSILDEIYKQELADVKRKLQGKSVTILQDGWSTGQNSAIIAHSLSTGTATYFLNAIETGMERQTAENCSKWLKEAVEEAKEMFDCEAFAVGTDNCNTMTSMRNQVEIPGFGCHSHLLNLLIKKIVDQDSMKAVVEVQKYFRNHHFESAVLRHLRGVRPVLPVATRWCSQLDCLNSYLANRLKYLQISELQENEVEVGIVEIVVNQEITTELKHMQAVLQPICKSLDTLQAENARLADGVQEWIFLEQEIETEINRSERMKESFLAYKRQAISPMGAAAHMLHPVYRGKDLDPASGELGRGWLKDRDPYFVSAASALKAGDSSFFPSSLLDLKVAELMDPINWWNEVSTWPGITKELTGWGKKLAALPASTGGMERCFSTLSNIITDKRNRLGVEKAKKLCLISANQILRNKNDKSLEQDN